MTINLNAKEQVLALLQQALKSKNQADEHRFETQLFEVYFQYLYPVTYKYFDDGEVDDVIQEFYLKKIKKIWNPQSKTTLYALKTVTDFDRYLFRSFINHCLTVLRAKKRRLQKQESVDMEDIAYKANSSYLFFDSSTQKQLRPYLKLLNSRQQIALWLKIEAFSHEQIGKILNVSPGAVSDIIGRAKKKIKENFEIIGNHSFAKKASLKQKGVSELIATIPDPMSQELLKLFFFSDMPYIDIATTLNLDFSSLRKTTLSTLIHIKRYYKAA